MDQKLMIILHDIRSAYNVGAIFRTADGAGVSKIFLTGYTPVPARKDAVYKTQAEKMIAKTALGAEQSVSWEQVALAALMQRLRKENVSLIALEKTKDAIPVSHHVPQFPAALIVGNEVEGVAQSILELCDTIVAIPMRGTKESLNVSVAAGIAMYALLT